MTEKSYPSQSQDRFIVRLPDGLRERIADAAKANGRSMNAEIVKVLETNFPEPPSISQLVDSIDILAELAQREGNPHDLRDLVDKLHALADALKGNSADG